MAKKANKSGGKHVAVRESDLGFDLTEKTPAPGDRLLSPNEIGKLLGVTGEAVKQWIYNRKLPAVKLANGYWKIKVSDFEKFIRDRREVGRLQVLLDREDVVLQEAITGAGHSVVIANNSADVLVKAADRPPSIFIFSHRNPELWRLAKRVRDHKGLRRLPILVLVAGVVSDTITDEALKVGIQGFLEEPVKAETIKRELDRVFSRN